MSTAWSVEELLQPIAPEAPCGTNLEDTAIIGALDRLNVFGRQLNYSARSSQAEDNDATTEPDWDDVTDTALRGLAISKDLRPLAHLGVAGLWTDGLAPFVDALEVAASWLDTYWTDVYPRLDEDAMVRQGALLGFADPVAAVNRLRRVPLARSRLQDTVCLRDIDIAQGQLQPLASDRRISDTDIEVTFADTAVEILQALKRDVDRARDATARIVASMETQAGSSWVPDLSPLTVLLARLDKVIAPKIAARIGAEPVEGLAAVADGAEAVGGVLRSRQDAIRALEAVAAYFRHSEPSSPVPLLVDRAKRLVSKDFLEVLADIAPEALAHARSAGGLPPSE
ncbi:MAG: type VI secretion system protein TssA [Vicinamibacterales bacterium]